MCETEGLPNRVEVCACAYTEFVKKNQCAGIMFFAGPGYGPSESAVVELILDKIAV